MDQDKTGIRKPTLTNALFDFSGQTGHYKGKVRDVYTIGDEHLVMVVSDRISAFDHILSQGIPFKGQVLNQLAARFLSETRNIVDNWMVASPDPNVTVGVQCEPYPVEMIVRGYLAGHAWREYDSGKRSVCGVELPDGLRKNDPLPEPIITPTTKAKKGHDEDISRDEIIRQGIVPEEQYEELERKSLELFLYGSRSAKEKGLILADTKYEFGSKDGKVILIDEIHTPDSSRYFYSEGFEERQAEGKEQVQLSKEFVREWLMNKGFQGREGEEEPELPRDFIEEVSERYIHLYEQMTGDDFQRADLNDVPGRIQKNVEEYIRTHLL